MALTVTVLGCSGSYSGPGAACSGYLVQGAGATIWLDAGPGTLANLQRHVALDAVDAVVLSHEHPDHCRDIEGYYVACRWVVPRERVLVMAPPGVRQHCYYQDPPLEWKDVGDGDQAVIGGLGLTFSRTDHPAETLAVRIDGDGCSLAYTADTGPGWSLRALGRGIDLALCDASVLADKEGTAPHMSARQAGADARAAGVGRLVLTHLQPTTDPALARAEAAAAFGADVEVATTGAAWSL
ncbi:MAG: MBL fold metallo-hydrolase [Acidimicrobiales bacterium]